MNTQRLLTGLCALGCLVSVPRAGATKPLAMSEIYRLNTYVQCVEDCPALPAEAGYSEQVARAICEAQCACAEPCRLPDRPTAGERVAFEACLAACPQPPRTWEKSGAPPIDRTDLELALLEFENQRSMYRKICYRDEAETVVAPAPLCGGAVCNGLSGRVLCTPSACAAPREPQCTLDNEGEPLCWWPQQPRPPLCLDAVCAVTKLNFDALQCRDTDRDGLPYWLETLLAGDGFSDSAPNPLCAPEAPCSFAEHCGYRAELAGGQCAERECAGACTAFHLELVALDDVQAVVHLFYDYSPVPARVLDLYLEYDRAALTLEDARPLTPLSVLGKRVAATHLADGTLRLVVLGPEGSHPIPFGPIIELVFQRTGPGATTLRFTGDDALQRASLAPLQGSGDIQDELTDDALWGAPIELGDPAEAEAQLRLYYGFDALSAPLKYSAVPSAADLCLVHPDCANESDPVEQAKLLTRLETLQAGEILARDTVAGVTSEALYLNGASDHLRLPLALESPLAAESQSFSFSTWFYAEGVSPNEEKTTPQVLFSHNGYDERTQFGLWLKGDDEAGGVRLAFFRGDLLSVRPPPEEWVLAGGIRLRTWHHAGFTLDAATGAVALYFDGAPVSGFSSPPRVKQAPYVACPQFHAGREVVLHQEGDVALAGRAPEYVYLAVRQSGLDRIERMDPAGLQSVTILGDGQYNHRDPDYHPGLDRLLFSSDASGASEIWLAHGDGSAAEQLTVGFGDAARGIQARRPRWAPDGSGIVFESNAYDVTQRDNTYARVTHLYYLAYDPESNAVALTLRDGRVLTQLDYAERLADQTLGEFRLTGGAVDRHHKNARWLTGVDADNGTLGALLVETATPGYRGQRIEQLTIPEIPQLALASELSGLGGPDHEIRLLTAHHSERAAYPEPLVNEWLLYERARAVYVDEPQFLVARLAGTPAPDFVAYELHFAPAGQLADCWDLNRNRICDPDEDRDGAGGCAVADCYPAELRNLYVEYDPLALSPVLVPGGPTGPTLEPALEAQGKSLLVGAVYPQGRAFLKVEVLSALNATPLTAGRIATLFFARLADAPADPPAYLDPFAREAESELLVKNLRTLDEPRPLDPAGLFEQLDDAAAGPDGDRLMLAAVSQARPVLLRTATFSVADPSISAAGAERVLVQPTRLTGLTWVRQERYYPCNWVGGHLHLQAKTVIAGFRGALDELKLYAGLRDPDAMRSEAERGARAVVQNGIGGEVDSLLPSCGNSHAECPPFHLCLESECRLVPCDPADPYACTAYGGRCTLRPLAVEQEGGGDAFDWVCAADCNVDLQCYSQQCLNGPCRYCDPLTLTCIECRETVQQLGELTVAGIEGCPDERSFRCVAGACVTECYAYEDGQSVYLCDSATEYCDRGQCVLLDWDWWDLAPATLSGGGEFRPAVPPDPLNAWNGYTQAVDQRVPIRISAYGVEDWGQAPEIVVEAKGGPFYGDTWHRIGRLMVHHRTRIRAQAKPYTLTSPHPFNDLRLRLITAPYHNQTGAASGLMDGDRDFCLADFQALAELAGTPDAPPTPCYRNAQGSLYALGYRLGLPEHEAIAACREQRHPGCPTVAQGEHDYLYGGRPAVAVLDIEVDGASVMNNITSDTICSYEGRHLAVDGGAAKKIFYGDIRTEQSNERAAFCAADPDVCNEPSGLIEFNRATYGYALLNCNLYDPSAPGPDQHARILLQNIVITRQWPAQSGPIVLDDGDTCTVELDAARVTPCYEWTGADPSLDPFNGPTEPLGTFELGLFHSFGHDEGFVSVPLPAYALTAVVHDYGGSGLQLANGGIVVAVPAAADPHAPEPVTVAFPAVPLGHGFAVSVASQPTTPRLQCAVRENGSGVMPEGGTAVDVDCYQTFTVGGTVSAETVAGSARLQNEIREPDAAATDGWRTLRIETIQVALAAPNAPFTFPTALQEGHSYAVSVVASPSDQRCEVQALPAPSGVIAAASVSNLQVRCRDVVNQALVATVTGLHNDGLRLVERRSGQNVAASPAPGGGAVSVSFGATWIEGDAFEIAIGTQPTGQTCTLSSGGTGSLPAASGPGTSYVGATLTCTDRPAVEAGGQVVGLLGAGLRLVLAVDGRSDTEALDVVPPNPLGQPVTVTFASQLYEGDAYAISVATTPVSPPQQCVVINGTGLVQNIAETEPPYFVVVCSSVPDTVTYTIGGTVSGLEGSGLRLKLNYGSQRVDVPEGATSFVFADAVANDSDYSVSVDRQPSSPVQSCSVTNGSGTLLGSNVTTVQVNCVAGARVTVEVNRHVSEGSLVEALLYSTGSGARLVARAPAGRPVDPFEPSFVLRDPTGSGQAAVPPGSYELFVFINHNNSFDDAGRPQFDALFDVGATRTVEVSAGAPPTVQFNASDFAPLRSARLTVAPGLDPLPGGSTVHCWWSVASNGPFGDEGIQQAEAADAPVLAAVSGACPAGGSCLTPFAVPALPAGEDEFVFVPGLPPDAVYALTCWVDSDGNGHYGSGDFYGSENDLEPSYGPTTVSLRVASGGQEP